MSTASAQSVQQLPLLTLAVAAFSSCLKTPTNSSAVFKTAAGEEADMVSTAAKVRASKGSAVGSE